MLRVILIFGLMSVGAAPAAPAQQLADDVDLLPGRFVAGAQPDGNSVLIRGDRGVIVFDAGRHPEHADTLLQRIRECGAEQVVLINSHWHLDHAGGLLRLRAAFPDAPLYASAAIHEARQGFLANYRAQLQGFAAKPVPGGPSAELIRSETALIDGADAMAPSVVVERSESIELFGHTMRLGLGHGVSGGDVWLFDATSRVLAAGDLVTQPAPLFDTACAARWSDDLAALEVQPFDVLVPGHGAAMDRETFRAWRRDFDALMACSAAGRPASECRDAWLSGQAARLSEVDLNLAGELLDYYLAGPLSVEGQRTRCAAYKDQAPD